MRFDYGDTENGDIQLSCALPLPDHPLNFVVTKKGLIVLIRQHSAIIQQLSLNVESDELTENINAPLFEDSLFFVNQEILDARLFNQTLALYLKNTTKRKTLRKRQMSQIQQHRPQVHQ